MKMVNDGRKKHESFSLGRLLDPALVLLLSPVGVIHKIMKPTLLFDRARGVRACRTLILASLGLLILLISGNADASLRVCAPFSSRDVINIESHPFGISSTVLPRDIPRGGAKSLAPLPPPVDGEAVAEAARAAAVAASSREDTLPPSPPSAVEAAQAPPPTADHTRNLSAKLSNAWERTVPALGMLLAATLLLKYTGSNGLIGLVFALQIGMYHETTSIIEAFHQKSDPGSSELKKMGLLDKVEKWWWFATVIVGTSARTLIERSAHLSSEAMNLLCYGMVALGLIGAVLGMENHSKSGPEMFRDYLGTVAGCHFTLLFLVGQSSFWIKTVQEFGLAWVLYPALLVIVNDTMAYVFGLAMGKHKLLPRLSPKKTVEGFTGALISTVGVAIPLLRLVLGWGGKDIVDSDDTIVRLALTLGVFISLVSPFGGFLASAVKRAHGAKDFGTLIPGHGGVVDRFDCQIVTAPFVYLLLKFFSVGGTAAAASTAA